MTRTAEGLLDSLDALVQGGDDGFTFDLIDATPLRDERAEHHAWRVDVHARLGGTPFERVKLDLVGQVAEVFGATEMMTLGPPVAIPGVAAVRVEAVDVYQHAAEKLHAYSRLYSGDRPSSRVKDLVDLVLLIESRLVVDTGRLAARIEVVYRERGGTAPKAEFPEPPGSWARPYSASAQELDLEATTLTAAHRLVAALYNASVTEKNA